MSPVSASNATSKSCKIYLYTFTSVFKHFIESAQHDKNVLECCYHVNTMLLEDRSKSNEIKIPKTEKYINFMLKSS